MSSSTMSDLDRLTLELLVNKTHYKSFLQQTDTELYEEYNEYCHRLIQRKESILDLVGELLEAPKKPLTENITTTWEAFSRACLDHLEKVEENENAEDNEMLFDCNDNNNNNNNNHHSTTTTLQHNGQLPFFLSKGSLRSVQEKKEKDE